MGFNIYAFPAERTGKVSSSRYGTEVRQDKVTVASRHSTQPTRLWSATAGLDECTEEVCRGYILVKFGRVLNSSSACLNFVSPLRG